MKAPFVTKRSLCKTEQEEFLRILKNEPTFDLLVEYDEDYPPKNYDTSNLHGFIEDNRLAYCDKTGEKKWADTFTITISDPSGELNSQICIKDKPIQ